MQQNSKARSNLEASRASVRHVGASLEPHERDPAVIYRWGFTIFCCSFVFFISGVYTTILGPLLPSTGSPIVDAILQDRHYAYLCILLIPTTLLFVIVNWGGFKYFANAHGTKEAPKKES